MTCSGAVTVFGKWVKAEETMLSQARKAETPLLNIVPQIEGYQAKSPLCRFYALWPKIKKLFFNFKSFNSMEGPSLNKGTISEFLTL